MQKKYNTIIVGGGASGLLTAVELVKGENALLGNEVLILERNDRVGKKLIATGNGQGNLMNEKFGTEYYHGDKSFVDKFVLSAKQINLKEYLEEIGIFVCSGKDGKVYPLSKQASSVLDSIRAYLSYKNCTIITGKKVNKITKSNGEFEVLVGSEKFSAKNVVLATGGSAGKQFGTDGSSYVLAENFGHKKTELYPSLVQLKTDTALLKGLKGIKETARVTAFVDSKPVMTVEGDLLFTDFGVSGSTIFSLSSRVIGKKNAYLIIEFLPNLTFGQTEEIVENRLQIPYVNKDELLCGVLNKKVGQTIIKNSKSLTGHDIAYSIKNFKLSIIGSLDFNYAQVTRGGIKTDKIDGDYQSKLVDNLYIVGEALNVDGDCGGYNLTFAFVSGIVCAKNIKNKMGE